MKHIVFTICSNNYFAQAIVLGKSLAASNPQCTFYVCVADCKVRDVDYSTVQNVLFADELLIPTFEQMVQKYSIVELNTAIKPYMFSYLFQKEYDCDMVTYLDPDIYVYKSVELIESLIKDSNFILTPHTTSPYPLDGNIPNEEDILNTGIYNLGYISIRNNEEGKKMVHWCVKVSEKQSSYSGMTLLEVMSVIAIIAICLVLFSVTYNLIKLSKSICLSDVLYP